MTLPCDVGTSPPTIAVVAPRYAPAVGGMESYARWVATTLASHGSYRVVVLTTRPGLRTRVDVLDGIDVVRLGAWFTISNTPVSPLWPWQVARVLRSRGVDAINAHAPVPGIADAAVIFAKLPSALTYHAGSLRKGGGAVDLVLGAYERWVLPVIFGRARVLVGVSPVAMTSRYSSSTMIPPGVDTTLFRPPHPGPRRQAALFVGRIEKTSRWKGVHVLINAWARVVSHHPSAVLDIVGDGDAVPELRAQAERLGIADSICWHGALPPEDVARLYGEVTLTVLPSLTEAESFGMVLVEAMSSGCAVVGSRVGGIPFVVRDGVDGLLVSPGDADELARALRRLFSDATFADQLGAAGREAAVTRWDWSHQRAATIAVIESLLR